MVKVVRSTIIDAPPGTVWGVLGEFGAWSSWHPAYSDSVFERGAKGDCVGSVRRVRLSSGQEFSERLLALSHIDQALTTCLLETTLPLFNYVSHVRLGYVSEAERTFLECEGRFDTPVGKRAELEGFVADELFQTGFAALRHHLGLEA